MSRFTNTNIYPHHTLISRLLAIFLIKSLAVWETPPDAITGILYSNDPFRNDLITISRDERFELACQPTSNSTPYAKASHGSSGYNVWQLTIVFRTKTVTIILASAEPLHHCFIHIIWSSGVGLV